MPLSSDSREVFLSIFKSGKNARHTFDWKAFNTAMDELGFGISQAGVALTYAIPARWGGGTLVLHMDHRHKMHASKQSYVKKRLSRALGWDEATFRENDL